MRGKLSLYLTKCISNVNIYPNRQIKGQFYGLLDQVNLNEIILMVR